MKQRLAAILIGPSLLAGLVMPGVGAAATPTASAIAQGYDIDGSTADFVSGAIVSSQAGSTGKISLATADSASRLLGVVDKTPLVALSGGASQVEVVIGGTTTVLVSNINGEISVGDHIATSPVAGVGMLATTDTQIIGTALAKLSDISTNVRTIKDRTGTSHTIRVGLLPVRVGVASYQAPNSSFLPPFVQDLANSIAGRQVSLLRVVFAGLVILIGIISVVVLLYAAVRSGIVSIGRNPLAAGAIRRGLLQVGGISLVIVVVALGAVYLILVY